MVEEGALIRLTFLSGTNRIVVFFFPDIKNFWKWAVETDLTLPTMAVHLSSIFKLSY